MRRSSLLPAALALATLAPVLGAQAQVLITEVQPNPTSTNDDGEWLELQNTSMTASADISGWTLNDYSGATESTERWAFPAGTVLQPTQTIVVAKFADAYGTNTPANLYVTPPTFEMPTAARDSATVPNLVPMPAVATPPAFANTTDGVVLRDGGGNYMDGVEYGGTDRAGIPGAPAAAPASAESLRRVAVAGASILDFSVAATPDPFTGYVGGVPIMTPPAITNVLGTPRHLFATDPLVITATVTDADGVQAVAAQITIATSSAGPGVAPYGPLTMTGAGSFYSVQVPAAGPGLVPDFHTAYLRFYVQAADTLGAIAVSPPGATSAADNLVYIFRNYLPANPSSIAEVRGQTNNAPTWIRHSAMVEGVALTRRTAFVANRTNFFIQSAGGADAIRVFSSPVIAENVLPGDLVRVTGMIDQFNGLRQIGEPNIAVQILSSGNPVPETTVSIQTIAAQGEALESQLVRVPNVSFVTQPVNWPTNGNVDVTDGTGTITVRVTSIVDLAGTPAPQGSFTLRGILGQFSATNNGGYQLQPRDQGDVFLPPPDAGIDVDAGQSPDTGVEPDGAVVPDGGELPDGGEVPDGGGIDAEATDTGEAPDASVNPDAAVNPDATVSPDATVNPDAAVNPDASAGADAGRADSGQVGTTPDPRDEGCSCQAERARSPAGGLALVLVGLLLLRRRRPR